MLVDVKFHKRVNYRKAFDFVSLKEKLFKNEIVSLFIFSGTCHFLLRNAQCWSLRGSVPGDLCRILCVNKSTSRGGGKRGTRKLGRVETEIIL